MSVKACYNPEVIQIIPDLILIIKVRKYIPYK
nr:MAG TPA: hypothetical protein [Caudoviricetes sp.]